jgi:hypothetical protein
MRVVLRYAQVVSVTNVPTLPFILPNEEEIVDAPEGVGLGWYRVNGDTWIPPESQRNERSKIHGESHVPS